ncbi:hypothetical protein IKE84_00980 [Candidatus Saccharibacteria bacterium]|nr:hypothetical protein [Candidatus Saccharibacteria bacterium]
MKTKKFLSVLLAAVLAMAFTVPVYANGGYIVRTTVTTVTSTGGVVTGVDQKTYDSGVQYGNPYAAVANTPTVAPATTVASTPVAVSQPVTTCTTTQAAAYPTSNSQQWVPNWGSNYAAEQKKYMSSCPSSGSYSYTPVVYVDNSGNRTIGDEARARADEAKDYGLDKGYSVSVSGDWGDCSYRNIELKFENDKRSRKYTQVTVATNGGYSTYYEYDGHRFSYDDVKYWLKDNRV